MTTEDNSIERSAAAETQRRYRQRRKARGVREAKISIEGPIIGSLEALMEALSLASRTEAARLMLESSMARLDELFAALATKNWADMDDPDHERNMSAVVRLLRSMAPADALALIQAEPGGSGGEEEIDLHLIASGIADGSVSEAAGYASAATVPGFTFEGFARLVDQIQKEQARMVEDA